MKSINWDLEMSESDLATGEEQERESLFSTRDVERAARDIVSIERDCFYGEEPDRARLQKIREKLSNILSTG